LHHFDVNSKVIFSGLKCVDENTDYEKNEIANFNSGEFFKWRLECGKWSGNLSKVGTGEYFTSFLTEKGKVYVTLLEL
jgi:hypothetical protein